MSVAVLRHPPVYEMVSTAENFPEPIKKDPIVGGGKEGEEEKVKVRTSEGHST